MTFRILTLSMVLLLAWLLPATVYAADLTSKDIEKELMCQCGCTMVVDVCECETANQMRVKIAGMITEGQDKDQILAEFVSLYGEDILAVPTKKGFNLVAWIGPFAAVIGGGTGLFFLLRAWARRGKRTSKAEEPLSEQSLSLPEDESYKGRLEDELKQYREECV